MIVEASILNTPSTYGLEYRGGGDVGYTLDSQYQTFEFMDDKDLLVLAGLLAYVKQRVDREVRRRSEVGQ